MLLEVSLNPNSKQSGFFAFEELDQPRPVKAIKLQTSAKEEIWDVVGVDENGSWTQAFAQKVSDSGAAFGYLIFGGAWGIRLKKQSDPADWSLNDTNQVGESYLIYADEDGLIYV